MKTTEVSILCIGNSHTAGFPLYDPHFGGDPLSSYEYYLELHLQNNYPDFSFQLENQGVCGEFSTNILNRLKTIVNLKKSNFILFWGGANDIGMGKPIDRILRTLQQVRTYCEAKKVNYFLLNIPPMNILGLNKQVINLNKWIRDEFNDNVIDVYSSLAENGMLKKEYGIGDGVHLSIDGYQQVAQTIFRQLKLVIKV